MKIPFLDLKREYRLIENEVKKEINSILEKGEYCYGQQTDLFEKKFAKLVGCKYCLGTKSGTDSLIIALKTLRIGYGDEVITTPFTFIATAEAIINVGARPVFVDIDSQTLNIDVKKIEQVIGNKTKAVIPVHIYGVCVEMDSLLQIAKKHNLFIIEDSAHAEGSLYKGKPAGSLGNIGCFSLYPSKTLGAYGNAGAIVTNNKKVFEKTKMISNHGRGKDKDIHELIGLTGNIDNIQAAILNVKLRFFKKWLKRKSQIAQRYNKAFENLSFLKPQKVPSFCEPSYYVYTVLCEQRDKLARYLMNYGIETKIYYPNPLHLQPSLNFLRYKKGNFPVAEKQVTSILSLPLYPQLTDKEVDFIIKKVKQFSV